MRITKIGATGPSVGAMGLGCMGMSEHYGPTDWDESIATIRHGLQRGVSLVDTADVYGYGHNEVLVGRAIAGHRDEVTLATKFGIDRSGGATGRHLRGDRAYVLSSCEASLLRLGVEVIDLYYLHRPPENVPIEETIGAMSELVRAGKVRYLGLSEVSPELLRRAAAVHPITAVQSEYSLWTRDVESLAPTMAELGVGLVPYSPLGRGFLTGTIDLATLDEGDTRLGHPRFQGENARTNQSITDAVRVQAQRLDATPAQIALAWIYAQTDRLNVTLTAIPGTRHSQRLDENLGALDIALDQQALTALTPLANQVRGARYGAKSIGRTP